MCKLILRFAVAMIIFCGNVASGEMEAFTLGSGDKIKILVYGEEDLSLETRLDDSGTLTYPFLGELKIAGLTLAEVEQLVTSGLLGDYLIEPKVTVSIVEYRPFFINGEVKDPNAFAFQPGLTVGKAISLAGGFTERANKRDIAIVSDKGNAAVRKVDLTTPVQPGDIITVSQSFF